MSETGWIGTLGEWSPQIHQDAWIAPGAVLVGRVRLDAGASVWYGAVLRADEDEIRIGERSNIQDLACLHADPGEPVIVGDRVTVGHQAMVHGARLESGCLIGISAVVLGGVRVGAGALVAASTVVLAGTVVPPGVLFAGVPGRIVRELTDADRARFAGAADRYAARVARHRAVTWRSSPAG